MMGMGFLRLNRMLAKHKWQRKAGDESEETDPERRDSSLAPWLAVMALVLAAVLIFAVVHTSRIL